MASILYLANFIYSSLDYDSIKKYLLHFSYVQLYVCGDQGTSYDKLQLLDVTEKRIHIPTLRGLLLN